DRHLLPERSPVRERVSPTAGWWWGRWRRRWPAGRRRSALTKAARHHRRDVQDGPRQRLHGQEVIRREHGHAAPLTAAPARANRPAGRSARRAWNRRIGQRLEENRRDPAEGLGADGHGGKEAPRGNAGSCVAARAAGAPATAARRSGVPRDSGFDAESAGW